MAQGLFILKGSLRLYVNNQMALLWENSSSLHHYELISFTLSLLLSTLN